jgi:hypothetical protein
LNRLSSEMRKGPAFRRPLFLARGREPGEPGPRASWTS